MTADQAQEPLTLGAFLTLLVIVLAVAGLVAFVQTRSERRSDQRGEYLPPRAPRGRV